MLPTKGPDSYGYGQYSYGTAYEEDKAVEAEAETATRRGFGKPRRRTA